jgi:hypothetical protein
MRYYANKSRKEKGTLANLSFNPAQEKEIIHVAGHLGLLLMERYVALATLPNPNLEDKVLATMLDTSERTVRSTRTKLTKAGWFRRTKQTINGEVHLMYDIGKQAVSQQNKATVFP